MTKQLIKYAAAVMTTLLALIALWQFRNVVLYLLISLALSAALRPLGNKLSGRKIWARVSWIVLYVVILGSVSFFLFFIVETAINEIQKMAQAMLTQDEWMLPLWLNGSLFQQVLIPRLPLPKQLFEGLTGDQGQLILPAVLGFTQNLGEILSGTIVVLFLSLYWNINQIHFERLWLSLLPSSQRTQARGMWRTIETDIGEYIRSEVIQSLLAGLLLGFGGWALGSPYPTALALIGIVACFIPIFGAVIAVIASLSLGLLTGVQMGIIIGLFSFIVFVALRVWIKPRLLKSKRDNPILTIVISIALVDAFGLIGLITAPPLAIVCQILWDLFLSQRSVAGAAAQISDLKQRRDHVMDAVREMDGPQLPLVTSSLERLDNLIEKAEPLLRASLPGESAENF